MRDFANLVVAARNGVLHRFSSNVDFLGPELRVLQHIDKSFEDILEIALEAGEADRSGIGSATGFNFGGMHLKEIIQLIAGLRFGAARSPGLTVNVYQARLIRRFVHRTT